MPRMRRSVLAGLVVAIVVGGSAAAGAAPGPSGLAGHWTLDRAASEFPPEIGFTAAWMTPGGESQPGAASEGGRRGGASGGATSRAFPVPHESADDGRRVAILTGEVRHPPASLTITETADAVTITGGGRARTFHPGGRQDVIDLGDVTVLATARWDGRALVVVYDVEQGHQLRCTYSRTDIPSRLRVEVQFVQQGGGDSVVRVYAPAAARAAAPESQPPSEAQVPGPAPSQQAAPSPPLVAPGSELKGLTTLGVVVEGVGQQSTACGLTQNGLEAAAAKALSGAGLTVVRRADEATYVYVNIMTATMSNGVCVTRYDVSLLTNTTATLPYQQQPALVQVALLHKGGLAGSSTSEHAGAVLKYVTQFATEIATEIQRQNR